MAHWAMDLGTTNSALARWDDTLGAPRIIGLPAIVREKNPGSLHTPDVTPSATHVIEPDDFWSVIGRWSIFQRYYWGRQAWIGRQALDKNVSRIHPAFVRSVKPYLQHAALQPIARVGKTRYTARQVLRIFLREWFAELYRVTGERVDGVTVTAPVDSYEAYRAEVGQALRHVGVGTVHFVDEPVAAAAGYGISVRKSRRVLVIDFGGGTLDIALVEVDAKQMGAGSCTVLAKAGRPVGGGVVDQWLLDWFLDKMDYRRPIEEDPFWHRLMLQEARWVKEALYLREQENFFLRPPDMMRDPRALVADAIQQRDPHLAMHRDDLVRLLEVKGLLGILGDCTDEVLHSAPQGLAPDDVLMVGGSTLLPGVFPYFEERFGRDRVRAWKPFEAVVHGACALSASDWTPSDFIVHDYGFVVHDPKTNERQHTVIVPAGTRFPTRPDFWTRQLVPTCASGLPERVFKLVVAEIGKAREGDSSFGWDREGHLHQLEQEGEHLIVPLNESNPTMGTLDPPHAPSDRQPRLQVSFGVDADRWLIATVVDLKSQRTLMKEEPVVRLL